MSETPLDECIRKLQEVEYEFEESLGYTPAWIRTARNRLENIREQEHGEEGEHDHESIQ